MASMNFAFLNKCLNTSFVKISKLSRLQITLKIVATHMETVFGSLTLAIVINRQRDRERIDAVT